MVMQRINLPALLPIMESHGVFTPEEIARLKDEHHSLIERMNFLLQYIFKKGQNCQMLFRKHLIFQPVYTYNHPAIHKASTYVHSCPLST